MDLAGRILWETNSNIESKDPLIIVDAKKALTVFIFFTIYKRNSPMLWKIQKKVKVTFLPGFLARNTKCVLRVSSSGNAILDLFLLHALGSKSNPTVDLYHCSSAPFFSLVLLFSL